MTERAETSVQRGNDHLVIGPSGLHWDGTTLTVSVDEVTVPLPSRLRGTVQIRPEFETRQVVPLDADGRHRWGPLAPRARVEMRFDRPALAWSGEAYVDTNWGDRPLEADFARWDWSRAPLGDGGSAVLYDVTESDGRRRPHAFRYFPGGGIESFPPPPPARLPRTMWTLERGTQADAGAAAIVARTLEDAPFYARSVIASHLLGEPVTAMHETVSLTRFSKPWVQFMLPFRMPRAMR